MNLKKISLFFQRNINYLILITVALIFFSITFGSSLLEMLKLIKTRNDLISQIDQAKEINSQLDEEMAQIGTQSYIERIARQYLELYYPNEQIVIPVENTLKNQDGNKNQSTNDSKKTNQSETLEDNESNDEIQEEPTDTIESETTQEESPENVESEVNQEETSEEIDQEIPEESTSNENE